MTLNHDGNMKDKIIKAGVVITYSKSKLREMLLLRLSEEKADYFLDSLEKGGVIKIDGDIGLDVTNSESVNVFFMGMAHQLELFEKIHCHNPSEINRSELIANKASNN